MSSCPERISLLRLDTDWYESTKLGLEVLYPRLSIGGVCILDDYGHWLGARQAVDEYFAAAGVPAVHAPDRLLWSHLRQDPIAMNGAGVDAPWLTIVTVVKDDMEGFARTAGSLGGQSAVDFEWLVVDSSPDRDKVRREAIRILPGALAYEWVEPKGVYPAMNYGLTRARGRFTLFLNAGDVLADARVLERFVVHSRLTLSGRMVR